MNAAALAAWFAARGWKPFAFQRAVWKAVAAGESGLLHATTGAGKTYAVWLAALAAFAQKQKAAAKQSSRRPLAPPLTVLWITPMRALAADTLRALQQPLEVLAPDWSAGARSGDTAAAERSAQNQRLPTVLVTTPESLSVLLSRADAALYQAKENGRDRIEIDATGAATVVRTVSAAGSDIDR